jgi:hypothetical protein
VKSSFRSSIRQPNRATVGTNHSLSAAKAGLLKVMSFDITVQLLAYSRLGVIWQVIYPLYVQCRFSFAGAFQLGLNSPIKQIFVVAYGSLGQSHPGISTVVCLSKYQRPYGEILGEDENDLSLMLGGEAD